MRKCMIKETHITGRLFRISLRGGAKGKGSLLFSKAYKAGVRWEFEDSRSSALNRLVRYLRANPALEVVNASEFELEQEPTS